MHRCIVHSALLALVALLIIGGCGSAGPENRLECGDPIPGQYLVTLADTVRDVSATAHRHADEVDGEIMSVWSEVLTGFAVKGITEEDAETLRARPSVKQISPNERGCYNLAGAATDHTRGPTLNGQGAWELRISLSVTRRCPPVLSLADSGHHVASRTRNTHGLTLEFETSMVRMSS